jgi:hypothetical protein
MKRIHMVDTFTATLVDKWDGRALTFDHVVTLLHSLGYAPSLIATYGDEAQKNAQRKLDSYRTLALNAKQRSNDAQPERNSTA